MKKVQLFYLERCPYCRKTLADLQDLLKDERFSEVKIEKIEESIEKELADQYDYYYVPCFFVDHQKIKEGVLSKEDVAEVLELAVK